MDDYLFLLNNTDSSSLGACRHFPKQSCSSIVLQGRDRSCWPACAAIISNDRAEAAGGCDADGTSLLAAMGLDGPQPAQAPQPPLPLLL